MPAEYVAALVDVLVDVLDRRCLALAAPADNVAEPEVLRRVEQASLVRQMCSSGARVQLAMAPAGAGKTTVMRALALAWTEDGGQVIGLAPSAAAAAVLGEQTRICSDTLAKLAWSLDHGDLPDLGCRDRPVDAGDHRRSGHGRHTYARHGRPVRYWSWCECPADR